MKAANLVGAGHYFTLAGERLVWGIAICIIVGYLLLNGESSVQELVKSWVQLNNR